MEDFEKELQAENEIILLLNEEENLDVLKEKLDDYHDYEIAKTLLLMDTNLRKKLFNILPIRKLTEVFEELDPEDAFSILQETSLSVIVRIFREMETDDLVDIISAIDDKDDRITYLSLIDVNKRLTIKSLLDFEQGLVGSIMNNDFIAINKNFTVKKAIKTVVNLAPEIEFIHNIYIIDEAGVL